MFGIHTRNTFTFKTPWRSPGCATLPKPWSHPCFNVVEISIAIEPRCIYLLVISTSLSFPSVCLDTPSELVFLVPLHLPNLYMLDYSKLNLNFPPIIIGTPLIISSKYIDWNAICMWKVSWAEVTLSSAVYCQPLSLMVDRNSVLPAAQAHTPTAILGSFFLFYLASA